MYIGPKILKSIHTWFNLNCSSTVGVWYWVDYTPATQVRRRLRTSDQRELIEAYLKWNIDNLSDSSCSTRIPGSGECYVSYFFLYFDFLLISFCTVDSRYLEFQGTVWKYFEISVHRHIRFAELRKKSIEQPHFTNEYVIWLLKLEIYWKYCGQEERSNFLSFTQYFVTCC